jgi:hypothetical protein
MRKERSKPMDDPAKKRQQYVRKKVTAGTLALLFGCLAVGGGLFAAWFAYVLVTWEEHPEHTGYGLHPDLLVSGFPLWAVPTAVALFGWWHSYASVKEVRLLPYVPPVAEQIDALPVDQVLVRGSEQPAASPAELVRASLPTEQTAPEELLRPIV